MFTHDFYMTYLIYNLFDRLNDKKKDIEIFLQLFY